MIVRYQIRITGIVQGVGFRPFIYRLARQFQLKGKVYNDTEGVLIDAEGEDDQLRSFLEEIRAQSPPLSNIHRIEFTKEPSLGFKEFVIGESALTYARTAPVPPDAAVCNDCLKEFFDEKDRRYHYPFITCTNCGPRFSIIHDIPYDRINTSMNEFTMCPRCLSEYGDPVDRRFHTQPNACARCGPHLRLLSPDGRLITEKTGEIVERTIALLRDGGIAAIKGVGGYLIACDALNDTAVMKLRNRKNRPFKPFALMVGSMAKAEEFLHITPEEERLLQSVERPIVLCRERVPLLSRHIAPGLKHAGVMLPYMPLQHLVFSRDPDLVLVMTSGNVSDEPIIFRDREAMEELGSIADIFISYNRDIVEFTDDSVLFVEEEQGFFIRRSRGYVPAPLPVRKVRGTLLATGGDLKNIFALARNETIIMSQFLGDMASPSSHALFEKTLGHFRKIYSMEPDTVVSDLHPGYFTTAIADRLEAEGLRRIRVQHHHAHIASVTEDRGIHGPAIGIAYDGTGYGDDGLLWGSEILIVDGPDFERMAHFSYFPLPGGESAIRDVWKTGLALLYGCFGDRVPFLNDLPRSPVVLEIIKKKINCPLTCSIGRIFDGASAIMGISTSVSTEAEAAMLLEEKAAMVMDCSDTIPFPTDIPIQEGSPMIIPTDRIIRWIAEMMTEKIPVELIAAGFHRAVIDLTVGACERIRERSRVNRVVLSGGSFQNRLLLRGIWRGLLQKRFDIYTPRNVPFNDGCLALGQIAVARAKAERKGC